MQSGNEPDPAYGYTAHLRGTSFEDARAREQRMR
jgi:hypothetical protein